MNNALSLLVKTICVTLLLALGAAHSQASVLYWYNGDPYPTPRGVNNGENITFFGKIRQYDDFVVKDEPIIVCGMFQNSYASNVFVGSGITQAYWEIRSGVSANNGGTLIASGYGAVTTSSPGFALPANLNPNFTWASYTFTVAVPNIALNPGTYWITVDPVGVNPGSNEVYFTHGLNAVGNPPALGNNNNSFYSTSGVPLPFTDANFEPASILNGGAQTDFSMGVLVCPPEEAPGVPEPSSLVIMLGLGGMASVYARRRKMSRV